MTTGQTTIDVADRHSQRLPMPRTPILGRDGQVERLLELLQSPASRLVTLTGPVGVGKTRLALEVALRVRRSGTRRVAMVDVSELAHVEDPWPVVAAQLGTRLPIGAALRDEIVEHLLSSPMVLVVDGIEHRPEVACELVGMAAGGSGLHVLATGARPLRTAGERVDPVSPLAVPEGPGGWRACADTAAVALFMDRAARIRPDFSLTDATGPHVVEVCRRLRGLPLSLELAAARLSVLPIDQLATQLGEAEALRVLGRGAADAPRRHGSLRAALAWSWSLMDDRQQRICRRLSIPDGPFDIDFVAAVADAGEDDWALDDLADLVEAHLVVLVPAADDDAQARFRLPGLVRAYARERLEEADEVHLATGRHVAWCRSLAVRVVDADRPADEVAMLQLVEEHQVDLSRALRWAWGDGDVATAADIFLVSAMLEEKLGYDPVCGDLRDAVVAAAASDPELPTRRQAQVRGWSAHQALARLDTLPPDSSIPGELETAAALAREAGDPDVRLLTLSFVAVAVRKTHDMEAAVTAVQEGRGLARRTSRPAWAARFDAWAGMLAEHSGDVVQARSLGIGALAAARAAGDSRGVVLAGLLCHSMAHHEAPGLVLPSMEELLERALAVGDRVLARWLRAGLAAQAARAGDWTTAAAAVLDHVRALGPVPTVVELSPSVMVLTAAAAHRGDLRTAARFHGFLVASMPEVAASVPVHFTQAHEALVQQLRERLGSSAFDAEVAAGRATRRDGMVDTARRYAASIAAEASPPDRTRVPIASPMSDRSAAEAGLAPRQLEVLELLARGISDKEIGRELGLSHKTVMNHNLAIYRKLGVNSRAAATAWAMGARPMDASA